MDPRPDDPATVGRYRVQARLGDDELGRLLLGADEAGRHAAVRLVDADLAAAPGFRDRFRQEIRSAAGAPPWFVAAVLDADPDADPPWLATALVEGPTLHDFVTANGPLGEQGTAALAGRTADGLVALHSSGLAHRDLVPGNVVLAEDGPRLINFGVRRAADPVWLAPELATSGTDPGLPGDVFAWGALVVFAATGRSPFAAATPADVLERLRSGDPDPGPLPGPLRAAVLASLARDPAVRPTATQLRDLLAESTDTAAVTRAIPMNARETMIGPPVPPPPGTPHATRSFAPPAGPQSYGAGFAAAPAG
ncbi:MAG TPA: serine/threonine-protein kinase, partial [Pseudonocardia sp.]|nr:serine/threonine-protein kinase [Pseudonocardia sp.]